MGDFFKYCGHLEFYAAEFAQFQGDSVIVDLIFHEIRVRSECLKVDNNLVTGIDDWQAFRKHKTFEFDHCKTEKKILIIF